MDWIKSIFATFFVRNSDTGSPLPNVQHLQMSTKQLKNRLLIVGDVHGCLDELKLLLEKANYDPATTSVMFVGDLLVKGPKSVETLRWIREQKDMISVRGNHEDNILLATHDKHSKYAKRKVYDFVRALSEDDVSYITELPISIRVHELNLLIVHAGIDPTQNNGNIEDQKFKNLIRMRCIDKHGMPTKEGPDKNGNRLWGPLHRGNQYVVFGHDAKRGLQSYPYAKGLDSGCVYGKQLSALVIEDMANPERWWDRATIVSLSAIKCYANLDDDD